MTLSRRAMLKSLQGLLALAASGGISLSEALAQTPEMFGTASAFPDDFVQSLARELAKKPFVEEKIALPPGLDKLTYDQYRDIRFDTKKSFWRGQKHGFSFDLFHSGFYFTSPVDIYVVTDGQQAKLNYVPDLFTFGPLVKKPDGLADLHYAGFRLRYPLNNKDVFDEFAVFQGASYFRGVGRDQLYGLSARGLAVDTGQPNGEEFPFFRAFWIKQPDDKAAAVVVDALLDSQSITGSYRFTIKPGAPTQMDIEVQLFPRRDIEHIGIAPLTSMYLFDSMGRAPFENYRPAVHDSHGLMMLTGAGEWLWRPLANPRSLQFSAFLDSDPRGFGLMQRKRKYEDYLDLEAKYERRPSVWIEPIGDWGTGSVELFEIPTNSEINDNIVAFWHPKDKFIKGEQRSIVYRLSWCDEWPLPGSGTSRALVRFSGGGMNYDQSRRLYVVDFVGGDLTGDIKPHVSASAGKVSNVVAHANDQTGGIRLSFEFDPDNADLSEFRALLQRGETPVSETWLYRWTKS